MNRRHPKTSALTLILGSACTAQPVVVTVDMDAIAPGIQNTVTVPRGTKVVKNIAIYIYDPAASRRAYGMGYIGGLNRGIAFGHMPDNNGIGKVTDMIPALGTAAITGNTGYADSFGIEKAFYGSEVQYIESGVATPGMLPAQPASPQFYANVELTDAAPGDVYSFYLLDMVTVWTGGGGAFSTQSQFSFDSGGDVVPDQTSSYWGIDPDKPAPVPPAAFEVDFIDGPVTGGGALIIIDGCYADCDTSTGAGVLDIFDFLCFQDSFIKGGAYACECEKFTQWRCDVFDFLCFQDAFVSGCP